MPTVGVRIVRFCVRGLLAKKTDASKNETTFG